MNDNIDIMKIIEFSGLKINYENYLKLIDSRMKVNSYCSKSFSSIDISDIISKLEDFERKFYTFGDEAKAYNKIGKTELLERLSTILRDISFEIQKYKSQYQDKLNDERRSLNIPIAPGINNDDKINSMTKERVEAGKYEKAINDEMHKKWEADLLEICRHCREYLSGNYYNREICPNCGRYLHK